VEGFHVSVIIKNMAGYLVEFLIKKNICITLNELMRSSVLWVGQLYPAVSVTLSHVDIITQVNRR